MRNSDCGPAVVRKAANPASEAPELAHCMKKPFCRLRPATVSAGKLDPIPFPTLGHIEPSAALCAI
jgi:hypothetical protein